jgi:hypothetical protein
MKFKKPLTGSGDAAGGDGQIDAGERLKKDAREAFGTLSNKLRKDIQKAMLKIGKKERDNTMKRMRNRQDPVARMFGKAVRKRQFRATVQGMQGEGQGDGLGTLTIEVLGNVQGEGRWSAMKDGTPLNVAQVLFQGMGEGKIEDVSKEQRARGFIFGGNHPSHPFRDGKKLTIGKAYGKRDADPQFFEEAKTNIIQALEKDIPILIKALKIKDGLKR